MGEDQGMKVLTPFVLGSVVSGGIAFFSNPLFFSVLTSLRYQQPHPDEASQLRERATSTLFPQLDEPASIIRAATPHPDAPSETATRDKTGADDAIMISEA